MYTNLLFSLFGGLKDILTIILAIAIIFLVIFIIKNVPGGKYIFLMVLYVVVIASGAISAYASHQYFNAKGGIIGSINDFIKNNEVVQIQNEFDFKNLSLTSLDGVEYSARMSFENKTNESINVETKELYVNKQPTTLISKNAHYIVSEYGYTFYDENLSEIVSDYLTIKFSFSNNISECIISTSGGSEAVKQWNNYLKKNNFKITLEEEIKVNAEEIFVEKVPDYQINLFINNELQKSLKHSILNPAILPEVINNQFVIAWKDAEGNTYTNENLPFNNLDLYATYKEIENDTANLLNISLNTSNLASSVMKAETETYKIINYEFSEQQANEAEKYLLRKIFTSEINSSNDTLIFDINIDYLDIEFKTTNSKDYALNPSSTKCNFSFNLYCQVGTTEVTISNGDGTRYTENWPLTHCINFNFVLTTSEDFSTFKFELTTTCSIEEKKRPSANMFDGTDTYIKDIENLNSVYEQLTINPYDFNINLEIFEEF